MTLPEQLLVDLSASNVRVFFRVYFIVLGTTVGPLGSMCSAAAARLKLSKGQNVKVTEMLGWLGGLDVLLSIWKLRTFPSGFMLTLLMLLAYAIALVSDLAGAFIRPVQVRDRCLFGTGMVLSSQPSLAQIPWNGYPYTVVQQATSNSLDNDGLGGIYTKVNQDARFSAEQIDVLGTWKCTQNPIELDYPTSESILDMANDLVNHGLLYSLDTAQMHSNGNTSTEHIVFVDTSNNGTIGQSWDVRACVSTYDAVSDTNTMLSYQCVLDDSIGWLNNITQAIDTETTIPDWMQVIQGACYSGTGTPAREDLGTILERLFNTMIMIASGGNYLLDSSQATSSQGCLTTRTWILWEVIGLAVLAALLNGILLTYWIVLKALGSGSKKRRHLSSISEARASMEKGLKNAPGDFLEWAAQATEESKHETSAGSSSTEHVKPKDLKRHKFGWRDADQRFGILREGSGVEEIGLLVQKVT